MFYYVGWIFVFALILSIIHKLSKHTKEILLWILKISIAMYVTVVLAFMVYVVEYLDVDRLQTMMKTMAQQVNDVRTTHL